MSKLLLPLFIVIARTSVGAAEPPAITIESAPPVVVRTVPEAGDVDVSPGLEKIEVTYSKVMKTDSWSCVRVSPETYPPTKGDPAYGKDARTLTLSVKLEPGRTYAVWFNSEGKYTNFKDAGGRPAVPYLLVFRTRTR